MNIGLEEFMIFIALTAVLNIGFLGIMTLLLKDHVDTKIEALSSKLKKAIVRYSRNLVEDVFGEEHE